MPIRCRIIHIQWQLCAISAFVWLTKTDMLVLCEYVIGLRHTGCVEFICRRTSCSSSQLKNWYVSMFPVLFHIPHRLDGLIDPKREGKNMCGMSIYWRIVHGTLWSSAIMHCRNSFSANKNSIRFRCFFLVFDFNAFRSAFNPVNYMANLRTNTLRSQNHHNNNASKAKLITSIWRTQHLYTQSVGFVDCDWLQFHRTMWRISVCIVYYIILCLAM